MENNLLTHTKVTMLKGLKNIRMIALTMLRGLMIIGLIIGAIFLLWVAIGLPAGIAAQTGDNIWFLGYSPYLLFLIYTIGKD